MRNIIDDFIAFKEINTNKYVNQPVVNYTLINGKLKL